MLWCGMVDKISSVSGAIRLLVLHFDGVDRSGLVLTRCGERYSALSLGLVVVANVMKLGLSVGLLALATWKRWWFYKSFFRILIQSIVLLYQVNILRMPFVLTQCVST